MNNEVSTAEILALKVLNRDIDERWVNWAVDMLKEGYETEHLIILAGESKPFNQFEMQELAENVLYELQLDYSDKEQTIKNYACFLIDKFFNGEIDNLKVLTILKDICIELAYGMYLFDFYLFCFAKDEISYLGYQFYIQGVTAENIDEKIADYFLEWKTNCDKNTTTPA